MVSLRKSRKAQALLAELVPGVHRRSARLVELEERKRAEAAARAAAAAVAQDAGQPAPGGGGGQVTIRKRGRKRKHVDELTGGRHGPRWQAGPSLVGSSSGGFLTSPAAPSRKALESALDLLQMTDPDGLLAMPKNIQEGASDDNSSPSDFGTVRTKLHDGCYVTLEHFESDVFSVTSKAKRPDQPETHVHKLAETVEEAAVTVFGAFRDQPDFEAQLLKWAANNRKTTGQLRIGGSGAAATGGGSSSRRPAAGGGADGNARGTPSQGRPGAAGGRRRQRKGGGGRSGGTARRPRRKTCEVPDVYSRDDSLQQYGQPERRWTYMPDSNDDPICNMVSQGSQLPLGELKVGKDISYEDSLMRFARHGGPIAESIARKIMEEQRAAITEKMERANRLAAVQGDAQWKLPAAASNNNVVYSAPTACMPTNGQLAALFDRHGAQQGSSSPAIGELTAVGGLGSPPPVSNIAAESPCMTSGNSYPPPSIIASSTGGISGVNGGASYPNWPTSDVGSSSGAAAAYRLYTNAVNLPAPNNVLEDQRAPAWRNTLQGQGSFAGGSALGRPGRPNYARHFPGFTSAASTYQPSPPPPPPPPVPQPTMVESFLRLGRGINVGNTAPGQLPVQQVDGFQYLLSVDDGQPAAGRGQMGGGLCGNMAAPGAVSASPDLISSEWKAAIPDPQPELIRKPAPSQAVFDLKLLQSRLGENPWGRNGISALKPWNFTGAVNSSNMEMAGTSNQTSAELSTLNLLGGPNGEFNDLNH